MKNSLLAMVVGFLFALGLGLSGMTEPEKVVGFLDLFGNWDPSLMFVMIGAIAIHFVSYKIIRKRASPLLSADWHVPTKTNISSSLIIGSLLFGTGWGLAGFCPGPALTALSSLNARPLLFVVSMLVGMLIFQQVDKKVKFKR